MFFGADFVQYRHDLLANLIGGHSTPLEISEDVRKHYPLIMPTEADVRKSLGDLLGRCEKCYERWISEAA